MNRIKRSLTVAAATGLMVAGLGAIAPGAAHAAVGDLLVTQNYANGSLDCVQDYPVADLTDPVVFFDPVCAGSSLATIANLTLSDVTVTYGTEHLTVTGLEVITLSVNSLGNFDIEISVP